MEINKAKEAIETLKDYNEHDSLQYINFTEWLDVLDKFITDVENCTYYKIGENQVINYSGYINELNKLIIELQEENKKLKTRIKS